MRCPFCGATIASAARRCPNCERLLPDQVTSSRANAALTPRFPQKINLVPLGEVPPADTPSSRPQDDDTLLASAPVHVEPQATPTGEHLTQLVHSSIKRFRRQERIIAGGTIGIVILVLLSIGLFGLMHQRQRSQAAASAVLITSQQSTNAPDATPTIAATMTPQASVNPVPTAPTVSTGASHPQPTPLQTPAPSSTAIVAPTPTASPSCNKTALDRSNWRVSASSTGNGYSPGLAIDNDANTFWTVGGPQTSGMWFQVDLGSAQRFCMLTLLNNAPSTIADYPRGYQVFVSADGQNWGNAITSGAGYSGTAYITFSPQTARYIRIVETVDESPFWWSIDELNVYQ